PERRASACCWWGTRASTCAPRARAESHSAASPGGSRPRRSPRRGRGGSLRTRASWSRSWRAGARSRPVRAQARLPAPAGDGRRLPGASHFAGGAEERAWLAARGTRWLARWDHLPRYCHHQKSWLVDAGRPGEVAFVGGINLDHGSLVPPCHPPTGSADGDDIYANIHDLYLALGGPAATDVHHNFVQRWNEASERERPDGAWPDAERAGRLPFPAALSPPAGATTVQITRTVR